MLNLYYKLWADGIIAALKAKEKNKSLGNDWKVTYLMFFSLAQGVNLLTISLYLEMLGVHNNIFIHFTLFDIQLFNQALSAMTSLFLPYAIFNYFMIFRKERYKKIIKNYESMNARGFRFVGYFVISFSMFLLPVIIGKLLVSLKLYNP